jgi:hypothetical protein
MYRNKHNFRESFNCHPLLIRKENSPRIEVSKDNNGAKNTVWQNIAVHLILSCREWPTEKSMASWN